MSGLTVSLSPLPHAKPRLELYVWSLIEDARRGRVCALMPMTARCTSATNPVAPGTASVIAPTMTHVSWSTETLNQAAERLAKLLAASG